MIREPIELTIEKALESVRLREAATTRAALKAANIAISATLHQNDRHGSSLPVTIIDMLREARVALAAAAEQFSNRTASSSGDPSTP